VFQAQRSSRKSEGENEQENSSGKLRRSSETRLKPDPGPETFGWNVHSYKFI